ncbi:hypothetical protein BUALT_Bualt16G0071500 [Buddleja alternifolia]|uniref:EF-hand domain-containing protein n=1 Tax=Buddleja alternifolia TaxID=168488 RepID=A0AAV6WKK0_9LAMI|nr:hypothetical protein BUALT_Bualt16G0071500 [Buddleja alternifolia]
MIAILVSSFLLLLGLICTFSNIPPTKKFLAYLQSLFHSHELLDHPKLKDPPKNNDLVTKANNNNSNMKSDHQLRGVFGTFDKNNDGYITKQELKESLKNIGFSAGEADVEDMVAKVDSNGDGLIDFDEFCQLFRFIISSSSKDEEREQEEEEERDGDLREAFDVFDGNKDGVITVEELGLVLSSLGFNEGKMLENCKEMIRNVDVDGDGMVNFDEFKRMMKSGFINIPPPLS